jgi:hypothetical protein
MQLPNWDGLPVNILAACLNDTVATYKFYWFLSILESVEKGKSKILKRELFSGMLANAWFTVNYFHISFGKQDLIQRAIHQIKTIENITIDERKEVITQKLIATTQRESERIIWHFNRNVPHWFLSPWFPKVKGETDSARGKRIYAQSKSFNEKCLYGLHNEFIEVNPEWKNYLTTNARVLKDFCYWNLALYLQAKNPNVPDIPNKLIKPAQRNSLTKQRTQFWDLVVTELGSVNCIYTGKKLTIGNYAVEHFIPYNFVSHDLIWNLIPADKSFNNTKSDKLPPLDKYFSPFFNLQKTAIEIVKVKNPKSKLLEDYLTIFPDLDNSFSKEKFRDTIQPLITIASYNGFEYLE